MYDLPHATLGGESTGSALGLSVESTGEAEGGAAVQLQKQCQRLVPQLLVVVLVLRREMLRISEKTQAPGVLPEVRGCEI